jgi:hypothetical protein
VKAGHGAALLSKGWRSVVLVTLSLSVYASCGGSVTDSDLAIDDGDADALADGQLDAALDTPRDRAVDGRDAPDDAVEDVRSDFVDPGCPDAEPPPELIECNPYTQEGCDLGEGCYPYVDHPFGTGCNYQQYGTVCVFAGSGTQGALCGDGSADCAPGFLCVIGAQAGKRCAQICPLDGSAECPGGLICGETDVESVGVCA